MGYTTNFKGALAFGGEVGIEQLRALSAIFGEDRREHPEWGAPTNAHWGYLDLKVTPDFGGICWDGSEKSCDMVGQVNFVLDHMRAQRPDFAVIGFLEASGEERDDVWRLEVRDGRAVKVDVDLPGFRITCPDCRADLRVDPNTKGIIG